MAQPPPIQQQFHYKKVELFKAETLGVGSYGAVCKARCDELPCAAKILHPVMFQFNDPGAMTFLRKFKQECQFLRTINHPNIVQYIATSQDRETGLPVLLMELMDESLTRFLERSQQPIPYHTQVNLCHDIALALTYLHSNGMVHRDLSSNNVLLIAGGRAKVTDFGMSKLIDTNPRMTPLTTCPGTQAYMSPEALRDPPVYTEKLDCFSEGVLTIQIITRKFPDPSPAMRMIEDPRYPLGRIQVLVPEAERRKSHIDLIDPTHPLLPLALRCLEYNEEDRPLAQELCRCLATLKEAPAYAKSVQQERGKQGNSEEREKQIRELKQQLQANTQQIKTLRQQLQEKDRQMQAKDAAKEREIHLLRQQTTQQLQEKDQVIEERGRRLQELNHQLRDLEKRLSEKMRFSTRQEANGGHSLLQGRLSNEPKKKSNLKWKSFAIQHLINYTQPTTEDGETVYFISGSGAVAYDSEREKWSELPKCSHGFFALAVVSGLLTAVGGKDRSNSPTNKLLSLTGEGRERMWVEHFPPMPTKRYSATALCIGRHLVVAGGNTGLTTTTDKVEVMDVDTRQWTTASSLPHPVSSASVTLSGDEVYMLGGYDHNGKGLRSVFRCSLIALLQSRANHKVWQRVADLPVTRSACVALQGCLLAIGGKDSSRKKTAAVHKYNPATNSWEVVSHTPTPCWECAVAVLPGNRLMAVDGNTVFIGTLQ